MVHYILRTVYSIQYTIVFFDMMILQGEAVTNLLAVQIDFVAFKHKIRHYARLAIFFAVFCTMFSVKAQTVPLCLGDSQTSL